MVTLNGFDASQEEPARDFTVIPAGKYEAMIVVSETKKTSSGNGSYLELQFQIVRGEFTGRILWARLNLDNPSEKAVQIARGQLSSICRAVGVLKPTDSADLHGLPLIVRVDVREFEGKVYNDVKGFYPRTVEKEVGQTQPPPPTPAPTKLTAAPWLATK